MSRGFGHLALAVAVGALAACGSKDGADEGPKPVEEVKQEAAKLERPEPGEYRQTVDILEMDIPGMPKQAAEQMKSAMKASQQNTFCLSKEDADKGYRDMFRDMGKGKECSFSRFDVDGGRLDAQMNCQSQQQGKMTMVLNGTVTTQGSDVTVAMDMSGQPAPMSTMKMKMHLTTTRVGECKAN